MKVKKDHIDLQIRFMEFCENNNIDKQKYFIEFSDIRAGKLVTIMQHGENVTMRMVINGRFYSFNELMAWMDGYTAAKKLELFSNA